MQHGFVKLGAACPQITVGAPAKNAAEMVLLLKQAAEAGVHVLTFPALSLTGATCGDLFLTDTLPAEAENALLTLTHATAGVPMLVIVGLPVRHLGKLYNCAAVLSDGALLGVVPASHIPCHSALYDARYFAPSPVENTYLTIGSHTVPFGSRLLFSCNTMPSLTVGCQVAGDLWAARTPGEDHAAAGATVIASLADTEETIGQEEYRRLFVRSVSARSLCAMIYADAGSGESTTDAVCGGHAIIGANGTVLGESLPFSDISLTCAVADLLHLRHDRLRTSTRPADCLTGYREIHFSLPVTETDITNAVSPAPFLPDDPAEQEKRCARILSIQAHGLARRLTAARARGAVIALSGGLDSTLALIVTAMAMDLANRSRRDILSVTMPCFGTTGRTRSNAEKLAQGFGTSFRCIDIKEAVDLHFRDIGHDVCDLSVVYENSQARERTQIIMDIANRDGSLVIGTGDLSELALGWATYNGDHMSNYGVNGGIPKTLVRYIVSYYADLCSQRGDDTLADVLRDILATPVSPELLPPKDGDIAQRTEDIVGPYELHDFFLYHFVRWGSSRDKIRREALAALGDRYAPEVIDTWLSVFFRRFFTQQFKRSALPDGPKVGSVGLSPRGDWRMPSDAAVWD